MKYGFTEVGIRLTKEREHKLLKPINTPDDAIKLLMKVIGNRDREYVAVINLNTKLQPINYTITSIGTLNGSIANGRDIFKTAILSNAHAIIFAHNHPSGNVEPSYEDKKSFEKIGKCGELLGIGVLDNIVITSDKYYSYGSNEVKKIKEMEKEQSDLNEIEEDEEFEL